MNHEYEAFLIDGFSHIRPDHLGAIAITGSKPRAGINAQGSSTRSEPPEEGFLQTLLLISFSPVLSGSCDTLPDSVSTESEEGGSSERDCDKMAMETQYNASHIQYNGNYFNASLMKEWNYSMSHLQPAVLFTTSIAPTKHTPRQLLT